MMLVKRLLSSIMLIAFFTLSVFTEGLAGDIIFIAGTSFLAFFIMKEASVFFQNMGIGELSQKTPYYAVFYFLLVTGSKFIVNNEIVFFAAINLFFACLIWVEILIYSGDKEKIRRTLVSASVFFIVLIPLSCLSMIYMFRFGDVDGRKAFFYLIAVTKAGDMGGYIGGMASSALMKGGNHKILPKVSPKKSWEGTLCGLILSIIVSVIVAKYMGIFKFEFAISMGITLFLGGFFGDLAESSLKRAAAVKDSGKIIPGIGGVFDLVDSFMLNGPLFYLFLIMKAII